MNKQGISMQKNRGKISIKELTSTAMMVAIVVLMSFTPLGYLRTLGLSVSLLTIPVAIGAMVLGPKVGLILGLTFGLTSYYQCFAGSPFGAMLLSINPLYTFLVCVPTRMLVGWFTGLIFQQLQKRGILKTASFFIGGFVAALFNTIFYMGVLILLFWNTEYIQTLNMELGGFSPLGFVFVFVGINGLIEIPATCVIGGTVAKTLRRVLCH